MQGWVSIHRKIMNNPVWQDPKLLKLWMLCLLEASHKEHEQLVGRQVIKLLPGQFVTGRFSLAESYNDGMKKAEKVNERTLWRWLKSLEDGGFLTINPTTKYSVVSISNWALYQTNDHQMSNKCPTNVQQVSTNNNGNNVLREEEEEDNPIRLFEKNFPPMTPIQMEGLWKWVDDFGNQEVVCLAVKETALINPRVPFSYLQRLLGDWYNRKLFTTEAVEREKTASIQKRQQNVMPFPKKKDNLQMLDEIARKLGYKEDAK